MSKEITEAVAKTLHLAFTEAMLRDLRKFYLPQEFTPKLVLPVSFYIGALPYTERADNHNLTEVVSYLIDATVRIANLVPEIKTPSKIKWLGLKNLELFSWQSNPNYPFNQVNNPSGEVIQRHLIYDLPRILLLDSSNPNNPENQEMHALLLKCDRKDGYVYAGRTIYFHPQDGIKTSVFGNMDRNPDIESPQNLIKMLHNMLSPIFTHNQGNSRRHSF